MNWRYPRIGGDWREPQLFEPEWMRIAREHADSNGAAPLLAVATGLWTAPYSAGQADALFDASEDAIPDPVARQVFQDHVEEAMAECSGLCIQARELIAGVSGIAYPHPDCELHGRTR